MSVRFYLFSLIFLVARTFCFSQTEECDYFLFYKESFEKVKSKNIRASVSFDYVFNESLVNALCKASLILKEEKKVILSNSNVCNELSKCNLLNEQIELLKKKPLDKKSMYIKIRYSNPIFISNTKVFIFYEILYLSSESSSVKSGMKFLEVFSKEEDSWVLKSKKVIEIY